VDLSTRYMGLPLRSPLIASASPLTSDLGALRALEDHGAGAIVLPSMFEEELVAEQIELELRTEELGASPVAEGQDLDPLSYLELVRRAKDALEIPVIASLNCVSQSGWVDYARGLAEAGADAIELNIYFFPADVTTSGLVIENHYLEVLASVRNAVSLPIAMKLSPYFTAFGAMARALSEGGAAGLVLFNRFYQPDIDVQQLRPEMDLELSTPSEMRLPLLWIAILHGRVTASLAASTGVESATDVFKYLLAGADVVMTTSSLLRHGVGHMRTLVDGLRGLLAERDFASVAAIRGRLSQQNVEDPTQLERVNYLRILHGYKLSKAR